MWSQATLKLVLPAYLVPLKMKVTKVNGENPYILRDSIRISGEEPPFREVKASPGTVFMIAQDGNAHAIRVDQMVSVPLTIYELQSLLNHIINEWEDSK